MSLPAHAASVVNCSPVTCMPSPESPANRITARVRVRRGFVAAAAGVIVSLMCPVLSVPVLSLWPGALAPHRQRSSALPAGCRTQSPAAQDALGSPSEVLEPVAHAIETTNL